MDEVRGRPALVIKARLWNQGLQYCLYAPCFGSFSFTSLSFSLLFIILSVIFIHPVCGIGAESCKNVFSSQPRVWTTLHSRWPWMSCSGWVCPWTLGREASLTTLWACPLGAWWCWTLRAALTTHAPLSREGCTLRMESEPPMRFAHSSTDLFQHVGFVLLSCLGASPQY